mmetsp:Transcript_4764/g.7364  ORF Transcript_4764/g.7364 Transcript_4764/m.7364 type:complete len:166 (-) Transcript_4764:552-1049(-)
MRSLFHLTCFGITSHLMPLDQRPPNHNTMIVYAHRRQLVNRHQREFQIKTSGSHYLTRSFMARGGNFSSRAGWEWQRYPTMRKVGRCTSAARHQEQILCHTWGYLSCNESRKSSSEARRKESLLQCVEKCISHLESFTMNALRDMHLLQEYYIIESVLSSLCLEI